MAFGRAFLSFYAGKGYEDAYWVALFTMIPLSIPLVQNVFLNIIMARFLHKFRAVTYLVIALVNVFGTYFIIPYYGIIGAALVSGIATFVGHGIVMNWYYKQKVGIDICRFWKQLLPIVYCPVVLCIMTFFISNNLYLSLFHLMLFIFIFLFLWYIINNYIIFNNYEKQLFSVTPFLYKNINAKYEK